MGLPIRDTKVSWHKSFKESQKRDHELASLTMDLKSAFLRGREEKEEFIQSHETWVKRCEAARRAEDTAREAGHIFKISVERFLAAKEVEEARSKEVSEKVWQASQSNHKKSENLEADLNNLLLAMKNCGWAKAKEDTARLWAEKK